MFVSLKRPARLNTRSVEETSAVLWYLSACQTGFRWGRVLSERCSRASASASASARFSCGCLKLDLTSIISVGWMARCQGLTEAIRHRPCVCPCPRPTRPSVKAAGEEKHHRESNTNTRTYIHESARVLDKTCSAHTHPLFLIFHPKIKGKLYFAQVKCNYIFLNQLFLWQSIMYVKMYVYLFSFFLFLVSVVRIIVTVFFKGKGKHRLYLIEIIII